MEWLIEFIIAPYRDNYTPLMIGLEFVAVIFGLLSVLLAKKEHIGVFPTGVISTFIFTYILYQFSLIGDMIINIYYTLMSFYGWYLWTHPDNSKHALRKISILNTFDLLKVWSIFIFSLIFTLFIYILFEKLNHWTSYIDILTTGIFFVGMWLMSYKKLENWTCWIVGDLISIPLYLYKGLAFTAFQYLIFTLIAVLAYYDWKKQYNLQKI